MIPLSCSTCCFRGRGKDEIEETLLYAPKAGYRCIALGGPFTWEPGLIQWLDKDLLRRTLSRNHVKLSEVWTPPIPTESPEKAEVGAEQIAISGEFATRFGCSMLVQTGGTRTEGGIENTIYGLKSLMEKIEHKPLKVCLEPHVKSQILEIEDYDRIFEEIKSDKLGITVDTGHFHTAGIDFISLIRKYPHLIWNIHLKDHIGAQSVPIGSGEIDVEGLIRELRRIGYKGLFVIELEVMDPENAPTYVNEAFRYMSRILGDR